jgi:hypothetical protein
MLVLVPLGVSRSLRRFWSVPGSLLEALPCARAVQQARGALSVQRRGIMATIVQRKNREG